MILSSKGITKALISLRFSCSQTPEDMFCRDEAHMMYIKGYVKEQ